MNVIFLQNRLFLRRRKAMTAWGNKTHTSKSLCTLENAIEIELAAVWTRKKGGQGGGDEVEVMSEVMSAFCSLHERGP